LDPFWHAYLHGGLTGHSSTSGTLNGQGPLRDLRQWRNNGNLSAVSLDVEYAKLHNQDPILFSYADQRLQFEQLHFVGEGTDLTAHGFIHLGGNRDLDLTAEGHVDLKVLNGINPDFTASGVLTMNMTVNGTVSDPFP